MVGVEGEGCLSKFPAEVLRGDDGRRSMGEGAVYPGVLGGFIGCRGIEGIYTSITLKGDIH